MEITIKHFDGQYPSFNIALHGAPGAEPFLEIKGCKLVSGANGEFISYPSRKQENGKYWNHVYGGEKFNAAVIKKVKEGQRPAPKRDDAARSRQLDRQADTIDMDIPFANPLRGARHLVM